MCITTSSSDMKACLVFFFNCLVVGMESKMPSGHFMYLHFKMIHKVHGPLLHKGEGCK